MSETKFLSGFQAGVSFGEYDEDWEPGRKRALIGAITSGIGLAISALIMLLFIIGLIAIFLNLVPSSQR